MAKLCNCNLPQVNPCEYDLERNEGEKSLRPAMLPTGIKISPDETLQTTRYKCAKQINAAVLELELSVQNSAIVNNAIIKVKCIWMIVELRMKIMIAKKAQKMNNLLDMMRLFVVLICFDHTFYSNCLYLYPPFQICLHCI